MTRYAHLYNQIWDLENLHKAYTICLRGKRLKREVLPFTFNLSGNLLAIQRELRQKTYQVGDYFSFYVHEPKLRLVQALPFRDRIVQQALCLIITPLIEKSFISDTYACIKGRGTHAGADRLQEYLKNAYTKWDGAYCLKCDIESYFASINHEILLSLFRRKIKCPDTMWLIERITNSNGRETGIPIGNLLSQISANLYLSLLDHHLKDECGIRHYVRYMDDFCIFHADKEYLGALRRHLSTFLLNNLKLRFNQKTDIFPVSQGIDFLGYRTWPEHRLLRNKSKNRIRRKLRAISLLYARNKISLHTINNIVQSWLGHCIHADTYRLRKNIVDQVVFAKSCPWGDEKI